MGLAKVAREYYQVLQQNAVQVMTQPWPVYPVFGGHGRPLKGSRFHNPKQGHELAELLLARVC